MLSVFSNWFNNPLIQSLLLSPLMGVIFAAIFSGFDRPPAENSPVTVRETVREYRERIIYREKEHKKAVNDDPLAISIAATMCLMFLAWGYVRYSETILSYLLIFLLTTISFSITTIFNTRHCPAKP
jgi:phosphate/sulfate permease